MSSRTGKQCRERYINHLDPSMTKTGWTTEENNQIKNLFPKFGTKWSQYLPFLPGRSDNAIKNRYHMISKNNFEYCSTARVVVSYKRALTDSLSLDSDAETNKEESSVENNRNNLKKLIAAREELDREILALEQQCSTVRPSAVNQPSFDSSASSSASQCSASMAVVEQAEGLNDCDFNFEDFEWADAEQVSSHENID